MIRKAYIKHREDFPINENCAAALLGFIELGIETASFYGFGDIESLDDLDQEVCLHGHIGDVWLALDKIGKPRPEQLDYPDELKEYLGREITKTNLYNVRYSIKKQFVKPVFQKLFTGFIWSGIKSDRLRIATFDDDTECYVSDIVDFVSEYRCFILDKEILGVKIYKGDWSIAPNRSVIESAVLKFKSAPIAYSLDFGITNDSRTLLVEVNDGFSLGAYGLPPVLYAEMISARWEEMTQ